MCIYIYMYRRLYVYTFITYLTEGKLDRAKSIDRSEVSAFSLRVGNA